MIRATHTTPPTAPPVKAGRLLAWTRGLWVAAAAFLVCGSFAGARADQPDPWAGYADTIFRPVGQDANLSDFLVPEYLEQDADGFLWAGGESGLLRWDGYRFKSYVAMPGTGDGLKDNFVQSLHVDANGALWVGTVSGGLARYDAGQDRFRTVLPLLWTGGAQLVSGIDDDGAGGLFVATGAGIMHLAANAKLLARFRHDPARPGSLIDDMALSVLRAQDGTLWVGTRSGLERGVNGNRSFALVPLPARQGDTIMPSRLMQDSAGRIWIGTRRHGAYVIDHPGGPARPVPGTGPRGPGDPATEITALAEIAPSRIWLGTYGTGIVEVNGDTLATRPIRHDPARPGSVPSDSVQALHRDRSGIVWAGSEGGLSQIRSNTAGLETVYGYAGRQGGLAAENVMAVLVQPGGLLWTGSQGNGFQVLTPSGPGAHGLPGRRVFGFAALPDGTVLIGTDGGLFAADAAGEAAHRLDIPGRPAAEDVRALRCIDGDVWVGGRDDGLWQLRPDAGGTLVLRRHFDARQMGDASVHAIEPQPDGRLAVGTDDGFVLVAPFTGAVEHIAPDPSDAHRLGAAHVMSFVTDRLGRLWVGSDSDGFYVVEGRDKAGRLVFHHVGVADGLPNGDMNRMLTDHAGRIWISTDSGLALVDQKNFAIQALRRADGLGISGYWDGAGDVTPQGDLIFGGMGGLTIVRPDAIRPWTYQPNIVVTGITTGGVPASGPAHWAGRAPLRIQPEANSLLVEFAALDYSAPERNLYRYRLDGFDQEWVSTDAAHRLAAYTNLPPGTYTLEMSGSNRNGGWTGPAAVLPIVVVAAWYQTMSFKLAEAAVAMLLLGAAAQAWTALLRQRQRELERQVAERTAELTATQKKLQHFAYFDTLTALQNRRAFNEQFRQLIEESVCTARRFGLVLIDLDGLKATNDTIGHDAGDALLVQAASRLRDAVRDGDFVARLGGDEFAVLVPEVRDLGSLETMCERIVSNLALPMVVGDAAVNTGASLGVALFPDHGHTQEELYRHVDQALYAAKRTGRGTWRWYEAVRLKALS